MTQDIQNFIEYLHREKQTSKNTEVSYARDLRKMSGYLEEHGIREVGAVTSTNLNSYVLYLEKEGRKPATISRSIASMKAFFHYLEKDEQAIRAIDSTDSRYLPRQKTALHYKLEKARKKFTGSPLADAEAYNLKGEKVKLSQWIGKGYYTLLYVEGWYHQTAGLEKYLIKKAYQKYQHPAKQLELITCHSFNRYEDWLEKIKEDELPGIQLNEPERFTINANYSNAVGGSNLMLFDPDGRVVRSNIRPDQLDQLLFILLDE